MAEVVTKGFALYWYTFYVKDLPRMDFFITYYVVRCYKTHQKMYESIESNCCETWTAFDAHLYVMDERGQYIQNSLIILRHK